MIFLIPVNALYVAAAILAVPLLLLLRARFSRGPATNGIGGIKHKRIRRTPAEIEELKFLQSLPIDGWQPLYEECKKISVMTVGGRGLLARREFLWRRLFDFRHIYFSVPPITEKQMVEFLSRLLESNAEHIGHLVPMFADFLGCVRSENNNLTYITTNKKKEGEKPTFEQWVNKMIKK